MDVEGSGTRGRRGNCAAIHTIGTCRCLRLAILATVVVYVGQLILYHVSSTSFFGPRGTALNSYYTAPSSGELPEGGMFLKMEEEEIGGDVILLVDSAAQWIGNSTDDENNTEDEALDPCPVSPPGLVGRLKVDTNPVSLEEQERAHPPLGLGGHFLPRNCTARHKVAIIIPYRDRRKHLTVLIHHLHPILQRQLIEYNIYVVQQAGVNQFNRGKLMNVGFMEAMKQLPFDCIILHDVDLVPEDDRNLYTCSESPRHMSASISSHNYRHRILRRGKRRFTTDGLSNLKYQILSTERRHLFTWMLVDIKSH